MTGASLCITGADVSAARAGGCAARRRREHVRRCFWLIVCELNAQSVNDFIFDHHLVPGHCVVSFACAQPPPTHRAHDSSRRPSPSSSDCSADLFAATPSVVKRDVLYTVCSSVTNWSRYVSAVYNCVCRRCSFVCRSCRFTITTGAPHLQLAARERTRVCMPVPLAVASRTSFIRTCRVAAARRHRARLLAVVCVRSYE